MANKFMENKFIMKETTVSNKIEYVVQASDFGESITENRARAYEIFDRLKRYGYNNVVLKKVTTNVETEYLERG